MLSKIINWWAAFAEIPLPGLRCPPSADGALQTARAVIARSDWNGQFITAFVGTVVLALFGVLITYYSRQAGNAFARRWRKGFFITAAVSGVLCLLFLVSVNVHTFGCQYGDVSTHIPLGFALTRASVAFTQSMLFFLAWSFLATRLARVTRSPTWLFDKSRFPF